MPYSRTSELPAWVRKLPKRRQRQYLAVFNSTFKRTNSESRAFAAAASVVRGKKELELEAEDILAYSYKDSSKSLAW